jgi:hypothetical protein
MKALRRLIALFAFVAVFFGVVKSMFKWLAQSGDDDHEIFSDEEHEQV